MRVWVRKLQPEALRSTGIHLILSPILAIVCYLAADWIVGGVSLGDFLDKNDYSFRESLGLLFFGASGSFVGYAGLLFEDITDHYSSGNYWGLGYLLLIPLVLLFCFPLAVIGFLGILIIKYAPTNKEIFIAVPILITSLGLVYYYKKRQKDKFIYAIMSCDVPRVKAFLSKRPNLARNVDREDGFTHLHRAANAGIGDKIMVTLVRLQKEGRELDPFGLATEIAELLLAHGAEVNATSVCRTTPLHLAVHHGNWKLVVLLLARGAEVNAKNSTGETPLKIAWGKKLYNGAPVYESLVKLLKKHGATY